MSAVDIDSPLQDQAEAWVVRLNSDQVSEQDMQQFALWLAEGDGHRQCFDQVFADWQKLAVVKELPFDIDAIMAACLDTKSLDKKSSDTNCSDTTRTDIPTTQSSESSNTVTTLPQRRRRWSSLMAVAASLLLAAVLIPQWMAVDVSYRDYQSGIGEQRTLELDDGSVVRLNTNTRLTVAYSDKQRQITLNRGEAFFEVATDRERPFTVNGCGTEARALGTAFNVRCELQRGAVTVTEGTVQVTDLRSSPGQKQDRQHILTSGQQLALAETGSLAMPVYVKDDSATSWRNGELVFNGITLREVVNEISRYTPRKILIASPALAATRVTGRFEIQDAEALLLALQDNLQMVVVSRPDGNLLLHKALL